MRTEMRMVVNRLSSMMPMSPGIGLLILKAWSRSGMDPRVYLWFVGTEMSSEPGGAERQAAALSQEGVELTVDAMGEIYVDLPRHGWFPLELPQEI